MYTVPVRSVVSTGLDWFGFSWAMKNDAIIGGCLEKLQTKCVSDGYARKHWGANGYKGWTTGALSLGYRTEGGYCEARSVMALPCFLALQGTPGIRAARLDLQVTVEISADDARLHEKIATQLAVAQANGVAGAPEFAPAYGEDKAGWTQYLGAAGSDKRGRVYDKGQEQHCGIAGRYWRFEYQLRRRYAKAAYRRICGVAQPVRACAAAVQIWLAAIGVCLDIGDGVGTGIVVGRRERSSDEKTFDWLESQVAPSVFRLLETQQRERVERLLWGWAKAAGLLDSVT